MHAIPAAFVLALLMAALGACDAESTQGDLVPCRCEVEQCTPASCGYELRLEPGCGGQVKVAEILIDGHLEERSLAPGETVFPCSRTEPGASSQIIVRGGDWVWGPLIERCDEPADSRLLVLQCIEAPRQ